MVTVTQRPQGHKIIDQAIAATIVESYEGDALVTFPYHSLSDGDYVYIESDIDEYNGFWPVTVVTSDTFKIGDFVEFYQEADIDYYQTQDHDWSSIFLPIVYKLSNDRWPTNSIDTAVTVSSFTDDNGFTNLNLSGDVKSSGGGINALEFIRIAGATDALNGVWQIVEVFSNTDISINLPYDSANSFAGATVQYYYNNYQVRIKIYAGLDNTSPWEAKKPYEEVAELSLTPDENNEVMFSVSDYIQSKVAIKNNTILYSLPLNLDAFTGFYISTSESFDDSDNYSLGTTTQEFVDDSFEGYAIAGKLPFKNRYSGDYADYVYTSGSPASWLTTLTTLIAVEGYYFDVSFIKNIIGDFILRITKYFSEDYSIVEDVEYTDQGIGVYRLPLTIDAAYETYCVQVLRAAQTGFVPAVMPDFLTWTNTGTADPPSLIWVVVGSEIQADTNGLGLGNTSARWYTPYAFESGRDYSFGYTLYSTVCGAYHIDIVDSLGNILTGLSIVPVDDNPVSGTYDLTAPIGAAGIILWFADNCSCGSPSGACIKHFTSFTNLTAGSGSQEAFVITEELCINILETCEAQDGFITSDRRLLEDGGYRLLE